MRVTQGRLNALHTPTLYQSVLEKYGGIEHLEAPPRELIFSQTEDYVEYTRHGKIIKGEEDPKVHCTSATITFYCVFLFGWVKFRWGTYLIDTFNAQQMHQYQIA